MTTPIDPRFLDRRRYVREDDARRQLRWGIAVVVTAAFAALLVLTFRSPMLAIRDVAVSGSFHADVEAVLEAHGVLEGRPTINVRASRVEDALKHHPWVAEAAVRVTWPGAIEITVLEHIPAAWMKFESDWVLVSSTGVLLEEGVPPQGAPQVHVDALRARMGERLAEPAPLAALEFVSALPVQLAREAVVRGDSSGLKARVAGRRIILGTVENAVKKARSLAALLEAGIPEGARVNLIAPDFPAVAVELDGSQLSTGD